MTWYYVADYNTKTNEIVYLERFESRDVATSVAKSIELSHPSVSDDLLTASMFRTNIVKMIVVGNDGSRKVRNALDLLVEEICNSDIDESEDAE